MLDDIIVETDIREDISFFKKEEDVKCPACGTVINQEVMKTGSGRLDAGELDIDLHRNYLSTKQHGQVFPLLYLVWTCSKCYYTAFQFDFERQHKNTKARICKSSAKAARLKILDHLFSKMPNFNEQRGLTEGVAAYLLAVATYEQYDSHDSPTIRMAICMVRLAWLCKHIKEHSQETEEINMLISMFYRKAFFLYDKALELTMKGVEEITNIRGLGPDFDKEYGYDGVIYMHAWLYVNHDILVDNGDDYKLAILKKLRTNLSKVFGFGKSSKEKPSSLMGVAKETYNTVKTELEKFPNE